MEFAKHISEPSASDYMIGLAKELFPICRSITGDGVRQTLAILQRELPGLVVHDVPSGTQCFDWTVPPEWNIRDAYIVGPKGNKIVDFRRNNLHVVGYSVPVNCVLSLEDLRKHLYSLPEQPDAIPYITSYYKERWGFCMTHVELQALEPGDYHVVIDSTLAPGTLNYGELVLPGETEQEIFFSTYVCHPSMANNEISGPVVTTALARWLSQRPNRRYTYRVVFIPETIGSIVYLSRNLAWLKSHVFSGFNVTCIGDDRTYSYLPSRKGDTISDKVAKHVLTHQTEKFDSYSYLSRGSDERQYCSPGVDLPIASIMRSKYGTYPEYHTSLDNFDVVTPSGLLGGFEALCKAVRSLEMNRHYQATVLCEPNLGKRGLYPTIGSKNTAAEVRNMMTLLAYSDGSNDLIDIANMLSCPVWELEPLLASLVQHGLLQSDE